MKNKLKTFLDKLPWQTIIVMCLTLGLAPFAPPHFFEKLKMLFTGSLIKPLDWFDFMFHGLPWFVLALKIIFKNKPSQ